MMNTPTILEQAMCDSLLQADNEHVRTILDEVYKAIILSQCEILQILRMYENGIPIGNSVLSAVHTLGAVQLQIKRAVYGGWPALASPTPAGTTTH